MKLLKGDIEILIEAIDAWKNQYMERGFLSGLLSSMLCEDPSKVKIIMEKKMSEAMAKVKDKDEIATCLKAKLIMMKGATTS